MKTVSFDDYLARRPVDEERVAAIAAAQMREVRAYRLRELRESGGLTQQDVADELRVSQRRISAIESGDVDAAQVGTLRRYAEALGGRLRVQVDVGEASYTVA
jgi:DNA-binding XRE family transcriptional regulator